MLLGCVAATKHEVSPLPQPSSMKVSGPVVSIGGCPCNRETKDNQPGVIWGKACSVYAASTT